MGIVGSRAPARGGEELEEARKLEWPVQVGAWSSLTLGRPLGSPARTLRWCS